MKKCFKCGGDTTREARVDNNLKVDPSQPLKSVCNDCIASMPDALLCTSCAEKPPYASKNTGKAYRLCALCAMDALMEMLEDD